MPDIRIDLPQVVVLSTMKWTAGVAAVLLVAYATGQSECHVYAASASALPADQLGSCLEGPY